MVSEGKGAWTSWRGQVQVGERLQRRANAVPSAVGSREYLACKYRSATLLPRNTKQQVLRTYKQLTVGRWQRRQELNADTRASAALLTTYSFRQQRKLLRQTDN